MGLMLGNFSTLGDGYGSEVYLNETGKLFSTNLPDDFVLYMFNIYVPGEPAVHYINNDFIDAGHWATNEALNSRADEIDNHITSNYYTKSEVDGLIEAIPSTPGTGGSLNIDNTTIIEKDGVIKTAIDIIEIGGATRENIYEASNDNGFTTTFGSNEDYVDTGVKPTSGWDTYRGMNLRYEIECLQNGNITRVLETSGNDWAVAEPQFNGSVWLLQLRNFGNVGAGYGNEIYINHNGLLASSVMPDDFKLYRIAIYTPTVKGTPAVANECIDTNYIATRAYVAELIGGIENGSY